MVVKSVPCSLEVDPVGNREEFVCDITCILSAVSPCKESGFLVQVQLSNPSLLAFCCLTRLL